MSCDLKKFYAGLAEALLKAHEDFSAVPIFDYLDGATPLCSGRYLVALENLGALTVELAREGRMAFYDEEDAKKAAASPSTEKH